MLELATVKADMEETVMGEQLIRVLVDLNYGPQDEYPKFVLGELFPEDEQGFVDAYLDLIEKGGIVPTKADEDKARQLAKLPPREGDDPPPGRKKASPGGFPPGLAPPDDDDEGDEGEGEDDDEKDAKKKTPFYRKRQPRGPEKRVDFAKIENRYDSAEDKAVAELQEVVGKIRDKLMADIDRRFFKDGKVNANEVNKFGIPHLADFRGVIKQHGLDLFRSGMDDFAESFAKTGFAAVQPDDLTYAQQIASFEQQWAARSFAVAAEFGHEVERQVRNVLLQAMRNGEGARKTRQKLAHVFERYQEGSTKPGGAVPPWRLENIVRTNFTNAYTEGRLVASRDPDLEGFIVGYQYSAILDEGTTETCEALDGMQFAANDPEVDTVKPSNHFQCRSMLVEIVKGDKFNLPSDKVKASAVAGIPEDFR